MKNLPLVAIVGRANVGKSSIFNRLVQKRRAIIANEPGTTRDAVYDIAHIDGYDFWLVDTAGLKTAEDEFELTIQDQITQATESADVIMVVVEAFTDITEEDRRVAKKALKSKKPVILVTNKIDKAKNADLSVWVKLGIKDIVETSVSQGSGFNELEEKILNLIPKKKEKKTDNELTIALLGRPNVGKSHLFNTLSKKQQAIVADLAGTTRDVNKISVKYHGRTINILDTAGIRRSGKIGKGIEHFSVLRSLSAISEADICLLLIDVNEPSTKLDQKIAGMIKEAGKGLILVVSKWDSIEKDTWTIDDFTPRLRYDYQFVSWAPLIFTSAVTGQNVTKLFDLALEVEESASIELKTTEINRFIEEVTSHHPPAGLKNHHPKIRYGIQEGTKPPTFKFYGSDTRFLHWSYRRYVEREMREQWGFEGTPIQIWYIDKNRDKSRDKAKQEEV